MTGSTTSSFGIDTTVPSTARMYDYWLGGHDNFAADRAAALKVSEAAPEAQLMAVENRRFLRRAVRYLAAEAGIAQFLDIGTGLPTQGNVHQVAQDINPAARVVYVDNDPMVLAHSRALKTGGNTVVIEADLRDPRAILDQPGTRKLIDFSQPLAVLLVAVLHFISDDEDPHAIVAAIRDALPPGSYLVLSHVTGDIRRDSAAKRGRALQEGGVGGDAARPGRDPPVLRRAGADRPWAGPGASLAARRARAADASKVWILGGVGRKPCPSSAERMMT